MQKRYVYICKLGICIKVEIFIGWLIYRFDLEVELIKRGHSEKNDKKTSIVGKVISKGKRLEKEPRENMEQKLTLSITFYPAFLKKNFKDLNI